LLVGGRGLERAPCKNGGGRRGRSNQGGEANGGFGCLELLSGAGGAEEGRRLL